jgi:hypothetical protein
VIVQRSRLDAAVAAIAARRVTVASSYMRFIVVVALASFA